MKRITRLTCILFIFISMTVQLWSMQDISSMQKADKIRLKEGLNILTTFGDQIWAGWSDINIPILLIDNNIEYLMHHPAPPADFIKTETDPVLGDILARPRQHNTKLLAAYPIFGMNPAVVMGTAKNTGRSSTRWVITLLHEMFHVFQMNNNDFQKINSLEIGPQNNPMWQLNYPYPYEDKIVMGFTHQLAAGLARCISTTTNEALKAELKEYNELRQAYQAFMNNRSQNVKDYKYCKFQEWKEGTARYTEWALLQKITKSAYTPSSSFKNLSDFTSYQDNLEATMKSIPDLLKNTAKKNFNRSDFYALGAVQALLMDRLGEDWKAKYFDQSTWLDDQIEETIRQSKD
ncbi:hypothetical protein KAR48_12005 [bacterium]|nr:hypothetical protein [bacterium]